MNYQKIYNQLIEKRQQEIPTVYTEKHHIVPRCMNGSDDSVNLVKLTLKEHFIAHLLLAKIHGGKLWYAINRMSRYRSINSRTYSWLKKNKKVHTKETKMKIKKSLTGIKHSEERKLKNSIAGKKRDISYLTLAAQKANTGNKHSEERNKKKSESLKGRKGKPCSEHSKQIASKTHKDKIVSDETKQKIKESMIGQKYSDERKEAMKEGWRKRREAKEQASLLS